MVEEESIKQNKCMASIPLDEEFETVAWCDRERGHRGKHHSHWEDPTEGLVVDVSWGLLPELKSDKTSQSL